MDNIKYISIFNYGYDLLMINQWKNVNLTCEFSNATQSLCLYTGEEVLKSLHVSQVCVTMIN